LPDKAVAQILSQAITEIEIRKRMIRRHVRRPKSEHAKGSPG
jgi:hypothetical protein